MYKLLFFALAAVSFAVVPRGAAAISEDASQQQIQTALQELSAESGQNVATVAEAAKLCDEEKYLTMCAEVGKRNGMYDSGEIRQVNAVLSEIKGEISQRLTSCSSIECLVGVANDLAKKISAKNPSIASQLSLTPSAVREKEAIVTAAQDAGVEFEDCETMNPDTASVELLRSCARLAKDSRIQKYIPESVRKQQRTIDQTADLRAALQNGEFACGDGTLDGCGNFCLNPGAAALEQGESSIPPVCRQIAEKFFGTDGVKQLETTYQQVASVQNAFRTTLTLTLPDGEKLVGRESIRSACDSAFESKNLDLARSCGDFAVQNGFAKRTEVTKGIQILESFARKGAGVDFNECISNPRACEDFIPEEHRAEFNIGFRVREIMKSAIGFDPEQCQRGDIDQTIGTQCLEGSRRALPELKKLAASSLEAERIVADIEKHVARAEFFDQKRGELQKTYETKGGPGGCTSENECRLYCADSTHGAECLAFGAQQGVFQSNEIAERFQNYQQSIQQTVQFMQQPGNAQFVFPGQGPYQGFQPPGSSPGVYYPPGQIPGFTQPGPGFQGQRPGPSPECFMAIERGDFVRAREICSAIQPNVPVGGMCPAYPYIPCPEGYERETFTNQDGCTVYGQCRPVGGTQATREPVAIYCPPPSYWDPGMRLCRQAPPSSGGVQFPYNFTDGKTVNTYEEARSYCYQYGPASGRGIAAECESKFGIVYAQTSYAPYTPFPTQQTGGSENWVRHMWQFSDGSESSFILNRTDSEYASYISSVEAQCRAITRSRFFWKPSAGNDSPDNWRNFGIPDCSGTGTSPTYSPYPSYSTGPVSGTCTQELTNLLGTGCHNMGNAWFDSQMTRYVFPGTTAVKSCSADWVSGCSGGGISYPGDANSCPGFSYSRWDQSGRRYCQLNETRSCDYDYPSYLTRSNYSPDKCPAGDTPYTPSGSPASCPSGQYWYYPPGGGSGYCTSGGSSSSGCFYTNVQRNGQYIGYSVHCTVSDTDCRRETANGSLIDMAGVTLGAEKNCYGPGGGGQGSCPADQYWYYPPGGGSGYCKSNEPYPTYSYSPPQSCPSGQYWYYPPEGGSGYCKYGGGEPYPSGSPYPTYSYSPPQSCPSGQYWYYPPEGGSGYCKSSEPYPTYSYTPQSSYTPPPYTPPSYSPPPEYSPPPATYNPPPPSEAPPPSESPPAVLIANVQSCVRSGGTWVGSECYIPRRMGFAKMFTANIAESLRYLLGFFR